MEQWKPISGYEGLYEVSDTGLVRSLRFGKKKILSPGRLGAGYLAVVLCKNGKSKKHMYVHRLVAQAFIPNPLELETVNHKDENKLNNNVSNLEWMTQGDNLRYGTRLRRISLVLKNRPDVSKPVLQIDKLGNVVKQFPSISEASRQTGIFRQSIVYACGGKNRLAGGFSWKYV